MVEFNPYTHEDFFVRDPESFTAKLGTLAADGPDRTNIVVDYDLSLTTNGHEASASNDTWSVVSMALPEGEARLADRELYLQYGKREGELTIEEAELWWRGSIELYAQYGVRVHDVEMLAKEHIRFREGTKDLFDLCARHEITTTILSAGIHNVIEATTTAAGIEPTAIIANKLRVEEGVYVGYEGNLTHVKNKLVRGDETLAVIRELRPNTILVGDREEDAHMVEDSSDGVVLRIRVSDLAEGRSTALSPRYVNRSWEAGYDAVIGSSLLPVYELGKWIIRSSEMHG